MENSDNNRFLDLADIAQKLRLHAIEMTDIAGSG